MTNKKIGTYNVPPEVVEDILRNPAKGELKVVCYFEKPIRLGSTSISFVIRAMDPEDIRIDACDRNDSPIDGDPLTMDIRLKVVFSFKPEELLPKMYYGSSDKGACFSLKLESNHILAVPMKKKYPVICEVFKGSLMLGRTRVWLPVTGRLQEQYQMIGMVVTDGKEWSFVKKE